MRPEYNKIADQDATVARIVKALDKYEVSPTARNRTIYLTPIGRIIHFRITNRGFRTICAALRDHQENLYKHGYSVEQVAHSKADILDVALLQFQAE